MTKNDDDDEKEVMEFISSHLRALRDRLHMVTIIVIMM